MIFEGREYADEWMDHGWMSERTGRGLLRGSGSRVFGLLVCDRRGPGEYRTVPGPGRT